MPGPSLTAPAWYPPCRTLTGAARDTSQPPAPTVRRGSFQCPPHELRTVSAQCAPGRNAPQLLLAGKQMTFALGRPGGNCVTAREARARELLGELAGALGELERLLGQLSEAGGGPLQFAPVRSPRAGRPGRAAGVAVPGGEQ